MDLWDNEHPKRMRRLHPGIRAWRVSRSSVSGVMVNSKWNLIQYTMQGILPASCVFCLLFAVTGHGRDEGVSLWGRDFTLSCVPSAVSAGEAGEQRRCWLWAALGVWGNWSCCSWEPGGQDYLMEEGMMGSRMKRSCWQGASPKFKGRQWETQQKKARLYFNLVHFHEWNTHVFNFF